MKKTYLHNYQGMVYGYLVVVITIVALLFGQKAEAQYGANSKTKALFVHYLTQFTEWPANVYNSPDAPFIIGIIGDDPFQNILDGIVEGKKVDTHPIIVRRYPAVPDIPPCHLLYINLKDAAAITEIITSLNHRSVLTVSDFDSFTKIGGIVRFFTSIGKLKLQVNLPASKSARLNISPKLLQVAEIVK